MSATSVPTDPAPTGSVPAPIGADDGLLRFSAGRNPLGPAADAWLKAGLARALPDLRMDALFAARPDLFRSAEHLVVCLDTGDGDATGSGDGSGRPVGVLGASWASTADGERFLHIGVQFVARDLRGGAAFSASWLALLDDVVSRAEFPRISVLRTYNPVAYCAMRAYGRLPGAVLYPDPQRERRDARIGDLASRVARALAPGARFDRRSGRLAGIGVPADLYRTRPTSDDDLVNAHFARHTRPGDRILCMVHVRSEQTIQAILDGFSRRHRDATQ
ncbi:conserved hypothetical protein [Frankia canadensis]|uniref:Uncharacterized protein n=1 Tax=Frankia canadensis TaxID=1836972 RepID=A0A2I2KLG1_9ACTN|nr:hypothetical protein [Frankia canadensis]SNQ46510.1 conserved hypothetical protein [Frankia canadensis]SOU53800.1 conserved hypothetical protein [Frankia canadensis]